MEAARRRIYLPVRVPEGVQPTYAVLELVGFSSRSEDSPNSVPAEPSRVLASGSSSMNPSCDFFMPSDIVKAASHPQSHPLDMNPIQVSATHSSNPINVSLSQLSDHEAFVHVNSSDFRHVVQQFTGASADDKDLLPVTLPTRVMNRNNLLTMSNMGATTGRTVVTTESDAAIAGCSSINRTSSELCLRKAPLKLHERRKHNMSNLDKLTTAFHTELSPHYNPSPVSPLVSDFEKLCNATTPTSQPNSALNSSTAALNVLSKPTIPNVTFEPAASFTLDSPTSLISTIKSREDYATDVSRGEQYAPLLITPRDSGTGIYPQKAPSEDQNAYPTLLNLFPETPPIFSPRDNR